MANPVFETDFTTTSGLGTSVTLTKPSGLSVGDLMFIKVNTDTENATWTFPSGWTQLYKDGFRFEAELRWKIADSADVAASTFTVTCSASDTYNGAMWRVSGADGTSPINQFGAGTPGTSDYTSPSVTTDVNECLIIRGIGTDEADTYSAPTSHTLGPQSNTSRAGLAIAYADQATAGATGTAEWANTLNEEGTWTAAVAPAAGGGGVSLTAETGSFTHTGIASGLLAGRKVAADAQSYALTGQYAGLLKGFSALIEAGDFTVSGGATGLLVDRLVAADAASYTLTGIDAGLTYTPVGSYSLTADAGSFTLTGIDAGTLFGRAVFADAQSYALTGNDATLTYTPSGAYDLTADVGAFLLTGNDAALTYAPAGSFSITADVGTFSLAGQSANLLADRTIAAAAESFALTGLDAGLAQGRGLSADAGSFALTGIDAGFGRTYQVAADLGNFTLTGVAATLRYSEAVTMSGRVQLERGTLRSIRSTRTLRT